MAGKAGYSVPSVNEQETVLRQRSSQEHRTFSRAQVGAVAETLYGYMSAIVASYKQCTIVPVPPFNAKDTKTRLEERYLLCWQRAECRTTKYLVSSLRDLLTSWLEKGTDEKDAVVSVLVTWGIWRLGGNTIAWAKAVGPVERWGPAAQARVNALWYRANDNQAIAEKLFYSRLRPTRDLLCSRGTERYWYQCQQIMNQVTMLQDCIGSTIARLTNACLPWEEYCRMLAGVPLFGHDGHPGYCADGAYLVHRDRRVGFWAKECVLDLRLIEGVCPPTYKPSDRYTFTPLGWGAVAFIERQMGVTDVSDEEALRVLRDVHSMRDRFHWRGEDVEITDLQWNCCEAEKFGRPTATVLRKEMRERFCDQVPLELLNSPILLQPAALSFPLKDEVPTQVQAPELLPHKMQRATGRNGRWVCVVCKRSAQRKNGLSGPGCAGRPETAKEARLRTLGFTPKKRQRSATCR